MKLKINLASVTALAVACSAVLCLTGCQDKSMAHFKELQPVVLTDEEGNRYVAEHHLGNLYTLKPLKSFKGTK